MISDEYENHIPVLELTVVIGPCFFLGPESNSWPGAWPDNTSEYWGRHDRT